MSKKKLIIGTSLSSALVLALVAVLIGQTPVASQGASQSADPLNDFYGVKTAAQAKTTNVHLEVNGHSVVIEPDQNISLPVPGGTVTSDGQGHVHVSVNGQPEQPEQNNSSTDMDVHIDSHTDSSSQNSINVHSNINHSSQNSNFSSNTITQNGKVISNWQSSH